MAKIKKHKWKIGDKFRLKTRSLSDGSCMTTDEAFDNREILEVNSVYGNTTVYIELNKDDDENPDGNDVWAISTSDITLYKKPTVVLLRS